VTDVRLTQRVDADVDAHLAHVLTDPADPADASDLETRRKAMAVSAVTGLLVAASAAVLVLLGDGTRALLPSPWWMPGVIGLMFALAQRFSVNIEYRREALTFSLTEVPSVFALAFLGPLPAIAVRVIGSCVVMVPRWRPPPQKLAFNIALFGLEAAIAFAVLRSIVDVDQISNQRFLIAAAVASAGASVVGSLIVSMMISLFDGDCQQRLLQEFRTACLIGPFTGSLAALAIAPALFGMETALLSVVPIVGIWYLLQRIARLAQSHLDLQSMHGFAALVGGSLDSADVANAGLDESLRLIRARAGMLLVFDADGHVVVSVSRGTDLPAAPTEASDPLWRDTFQSSGPSGRSLVGLDGNSDDGAAGRPKIDWITAPIRDRDGLIGLLMMAGREGASDVFDDDDLRRTATLTDHLAVSLRKTILHAAMGHAALHDSLTGLPNRELFDREVVTALATHDNQSVAVLMLDLDRFKEINDTLGHHLGDAALIEFSCRVQQLLGDGDVLGRFGGDEFAVCVRRRNLDSIRQLADQILSDSYAPLELGKVDVVVTVSVGIAVATDDDRDATSVLRRADIAMYTAKRNRAGIELYRGEIDRRTPERLSLLGDLRKALETGGIEVHYQPKIDLATNTVTAVEALARWNHPTRGWIAPDEFIPVAEESGLIKQLTDQIVTTSIAACLEWRNAGLDIRIAVNLSTLDLLDELLAQRITHRLEQHGLQPDHLTLEITESSLMVDTPRTMATIARLHELGVVLSLDDFGTGYSSLSYLRRLPVAELKIDRSFVANILIEPQDEVIVRSTIDLGHNLGLIVVAEGIENSAVLDRLSILGCDVGQGYGISRPLPIDRLNAWLRTTSLHTRAATGAQTA
jgi:diguanylate cyclase (GGDEF)-like protein